MTWEELVGSGGYAIISSPLVANIVSVVSGLKIRDTETVHSVKVSLLGRKGAVAISDEGVNVVLLGQTDTCSDIVALQSIIFTYLLLTCQLLSAQVGKAQPHRSEAAAHCLVFVFYL
jgi:hypothetical protein